MTPWILARQAPLSMEFSGQEYWNGLYFLLQGIFSIQGVNLGLPPCGQILYHLSHQGSYMYINIYILKTKGRIHSPFLAADSSGHVPCLWLSRLEDPLEKQENKCKIYKISFKMG